MEIALLFLGVATGVLSGMFGVGGGVVMVPMLAAFFGMNLLSANATSLAAMLLPVGIMGVYTYYKAGYIRIIDSLWLSLGLFLGSFFGAELAVTFDVGILSKLYACFLMFVAMQFTFTKKKGEEDSSLPGNGVQYEVWVFILIGIGAGVIAGLFGKGGGLVIVPVLTKFFKYSPKAAAATSLAALQLPVGLPSVLVYAQSGYLNFAFAGLVAAGLLIGTFFGSKFAIRLSGNSFKKVYALFLMGVACYMVIKYL